MRMGLCRCRSTDSYMYPLRLGRITRVSCHVQLQFIRFGHGGAEADGGASATEGCLEAGKPSRPYPLGVVGFDATRASGMRALPSGFAGANGRRRWLNVKNKL